MFKIIPLVVSFILASTGYAAVSTSHNVSVAPNNEQEVMSTSAHTDSDLFLNANGRMSLNSLEKVDVSI